MGQRKGLCSIKTITEALADSGNVSLGTETTFFYGDKHLFICGTWKWLSEKYTVFEQEQQEVVCVQLDFRDC